MFKVKALVLEGWGQGCREYTILAALGAPPSPPLELGPSFLLKKASILNL
jgi:hypothetical protein